MPTSTAPKPYIQFPGTAREAMTFYQGVFGGTLTIQTNGDFGRPDGDANAVGHAVLDGTVSIFGADADPGEPSFSSTGLFFALLGTADGPTLTNWFARLAEGGTIVFELAERAWGASDGQVIDKYGVHWLVGFEPEK